ncbi:MAG: hypothetical protein F6K24_09175 [Okeania sp. SIO2D1]|nr:hypothetical protein [Okeania sp. SIO2D1]
MGRWGDGEMGRWGDGEIEKYLVMVEDGTFFYTKPERIRYNIMSEKEEGRRKKEEGRRLKNLKKPKFPVDIHP